MAHPTVVANWKMNLTLGEALHLGMEIKGQLSSMTGVDIVLCPAFPTLAPMKELLASTNIKLGAQNMHFEDSGAFTGEVSSFMLRDLCSHVIVGHSERRRHFLENDESIYLKLEAAARSGLSPILCVGESLDDDTAAQDTVVQQLKNVLGQMSLPVGMVIAYEPLWAIGTGRPATGEAAEAMMSRIRTFLADRFGHRIGGAIPLLYGGSVSASNVHQFASQANIDGALIGGASLESLEFVKIAKKFRK